MAVLFVHDLEQVTRQCYYEGLTVADGYKYLTKQELLETWIYILLHQLFTPWR